MNESAILGARFDRDSNGSSTIRFICDNDFKIELSSLRKGILRIRAYSPSHPLPPHDNTVIGDDDLEGSITLTEESKSANLWKFSVGSTGTVLEASTSQGPLAFKILDSESNILYEDLPGRSYSIDGDGINHYTRHDLEAVHVGMGEVAAPLNVDSRRIEFYSRDALGYDAYRTGPLYKQHPFLITLSRDGNRAVGEFSSSNSHGHWDIGQEIDGYWKSYRVLRLDHGGVEKFVFASDGTEGLLEQYATIVGFPLLPSRHWLGYLASSMAYAESESPPAEQVLREFPEKCKKHDIPCSAVHLSSGYTVSEKPPVRRNVFNLNRRRFPKFEDMCEFLHDHGVQISANIKPYLSVVHPDFQKLDAQKALFTQEDGKSTVITRVWTTVFQDDNTDGSWVDLTSTAGREWWTENSKNLLKLGIDSLWNDNNEFSLLNDKFNCRYEDVQSDVSGPMTIGKAGRLINTQMMAKCSRDASLQVYPNRRPFVLTRSTNPGTLKYAASSWSGDNSTSWSNMKGNTIMVLNAGLALLHSYGNDVGGFVGPVPSPELLLRWIQVGIYNPRFCIHSNKKVGTATEPWMYPEVLPAVRTSIKRRYELIPYLYALHWESHTKALPLNRWLGFGKYKNDKNVYDHLDSADFWLGEALLVAGVFEPGTTKRKVYLPKSGEDEYYYDTTNGYAVYKAGTEVTVDTPEEHIAVFAKVGTAVPVGKPLITSTQKGLFDKAVENGTAELDDYRGIEIFPPPVEASRGQRFTYIWIEDDGESLKPKPSKYQITYSATKSEIKVEFDVLEHGFEQLWKSIHVILPQGESRPVVSGVQAAPKGNCPVYKLA